MSKLTASMLSTLRTGSGSGFVNNLDVTDLEPGTYTLQFSIINIQPSPNIKIEIPPIVNAIITWKVEGQQQRRVVSVVSGTSISSVCQAVDVKLIDVENAEDDGYEYQVQVTLSRGIRANTQQPPQLSRGRFVLVPALDEHRFPVPQDSGVISFFIFCDAQGLTPDQVKISMTDAVNNTVCVVSPAPNCTQWIPVLPGTTDVAIQNFHPTSGLFANLIWGIDG